MVFTWRFCINFQEFAIFKNNFFLIFYNKIFNVYGSEIYCEIAKNSGISPAQVMSSFANMPLGLPGPDSDERIRFIIFEQEFFFFLKKLQILNYFR